MGRRDPGGRRALPPAELGGLGTRKEKVVILYTTGSRAKDKGRKEWRKETGIQLLRSQDSGTHGKFQEGKCAEGDLGVIKWKAGIMGVVVRGDKVGLV